ncbi:hypothetical protein ABB37_05579 [Leptomonas pyrrhocoris]|uniref:Uncharacterized protein n=1 Tax=Leptomonas pyrrhocoris TaxID=157538 RepID=A0A0M9FZ31_LEPPY|nr:hypothetical protein ABB37_05579 [Leptomonas pyrrhocoris]KPA79045.1 hypothetical protein ABB37_05579 [Leptomonas pyrrhocoris]|eukprot:XP_015657484.1 hypothetical protein ABB37_05579 [Leptomonas pyrrhocoris]
MDQPLHLRLAKTVLLSGILLMYVAYDTGFRLWMAQSDVRVLNAAIVRDTTALNVRGEGGLTFEAATEVASTPSLQIYLRQNYRWPSARPSTAASGDEQGGDTDKDIANHRGYGAGSTAADVGASYSPNSAAALSDFPMAAVVVESTWLSPDQAAVSAPYAQRLLEGFRYALLTGSPWLLLAGSAEETALGLQYLRRLSQPAETLFGMTALAGWPSELTRVAESIRASMAPYATLGAWMHGAPSKPIPSFDSSALPAVSPSALLRRLALSHDDSSAALRSSLHHLLSVSALARAEGGTQHRRPSALILGAEWLRRSDAALLRLSGSGNVDDGGSGFAVTEAEVKRPRVTVFATSDTYSSSSDDVSWESPRMWEWPVNGTQSQRVHLTLPGIVAIAVPDANKRARFAAKALQQLLEKTLLRRHARRAEAPRITARSVHEGWEWWWLGRSYGVTVVGGGWEQQRVRLLYTKALREAAAETHEGLRQAVQDVHRARCRFESGSGASSPLCAGARRSRLPTSALPFTAAVPSPPKVFVLPPGAEDTQTPEPQPEWLNYTGELPLSVNADASYAARVIGRWSYFIYVNYRRWMDWFLASLPGGAYQDHFVLASVLMSDLADHRISWRDVLYLR